MNWIERYKRSQILKEIDFFWIEKPVWIDDLKGINITFIHRADPKFLVIKFLLQSGDDVYEFISDIMINPKSIKKYVKIREKI